jgi:hypothetical protein
MVQYKAMEREDGPNGVPQAVFRLPNTQLAEEITRMDALLATIQACPANTSHDGYRLTENPFFLKLCSRLVFNRTISGLYQACICQSTIGKLLSSPGIRVREVDPAMTFETPDEFRQLVFHDDRFKAWVGTTPSQSDVLRKRFVRTLETENSRSHRGKAQEIRRC